MVDEEWQKKKICEGEADSWEAPVKALRVAPGPALDLVPEISFTLAIGIPVCVHHNIAVVVRLVAVYQQ